MTLAFVAIALMYWLIASQSLFAMLRHTAVFRLFAVASLAILALWQVKAQLPGGPQIHFLALTCLTLLLGFRLSLLTLPLLMLPLVWTEFLPQLRQSLEVLIQLVSSSTPDPTAAISPPISTPRSAEHDLHSTLAMRAHHGGVTLPLGEHIALQWWLAIFAICQSYGTYLVVQRYFQPHPFVYIFVQGFINSALVISGYMLLQGGYYALQGMPWHQVIDQHWLFIPLVALPEALLNGAALTLLVVYRPQWLATFRERDYFN
jgi:uncharacterized membrane protein